MNYLTEFRRLAGNRLSEAAVASERDAALIRSFAKKTKMGSFDVNEVAQALSVLEPGWKSEIVIGLVPVREGSLNPTASKPEAQHAWAESHGLTDVGFTYYSPTDASFSFAFSSDWPETSHVRPKARRTERPSKSEVDGIIKDFMNVLLVNVGKDETNPEEGKFYIKALGKPKVEETEAAKSAYELDRSYGKTGIIVTYRWKLTGVRKAVRALRLSDPKGDYLDIEDNGKPNASIWTWLYKKGIDKQAADWMVSSGQHEKDAKKKAMKGYTANEVIGTCGICRNIQKLRRGELVLHGYQRPGYGWIHGQCFGVGYKAWELSSEAGVAYVEALEKQIPAQRKVIDRLKSMKEFEVYIDDRFLAQSPGHGYRPYTVSEKGFTLKDEKKVSYSELKKLAATTVDPYKLDAANAKRVFGELQKSKVGAAEAQLRQMQEVKQQFEADVAQWKAQPLPGAQMENTLTDFRRWAGIKRTTL